MENAEPHRQAGLGVPIRKKPVTYVTGFFGPSVEIRTQGLLNPIQARYQTSPHPGAVSNSLIIISWGAKKCKPFFQKNEKKTAQTGML